MSEIEKQVKGLIAAGQIRISEHGYDELADDKLSAREQWDTAYRRRN